MGSHYEGCCLSSLSKDTWVGGWVTRYTTTDLGSMYCRHLESSLNSTVGFWEARAQLGIILSAEIGQRSQYACMCACVYVCVLFISSSAHFQASML